MTGDRLGVVASDHNFGQFENADGKSKDPEGTVVCVKNGDVLTIANIPPRLQHLYNLPGAAVVNFVEHGHNIPDQVMTNDGLLIDLAEFVAREDEQPVLCIVGDEIGRAAKIAVGSKTNERHLIGA